MHEDQKLNSLQHEDQDFISRLTCYLVLEKLAFGKEFLNLATPHKKLISLVLVKRLLLKWKLKAI